MAEAEPVRQDGRKHSKGLMSSVPFGLRWRHACQRRIIMPTRHSTPAIPVETGAALQNAILNSANFSSIATDEKGMVQLFNVGAERMLGYDAAEVVDKITPADI